MLLLPSGRVVDLSTDRAKYHALRQSGPGPNAAHKELYTLVDVIDRRRDGQGDPCLGWTEHDYQFSGYTLADIRSAPDWLEADKSALFTWLDHDDQRRRIETARRRLTDNQPLLSSKINSSPQRLYSVLQRRINALPLQQASAEQWRATINNMVTTGIREEEILWSGLRRYLTQQTPDTILHKSQMLAAIDFGNIRLELSTEQTWNENGDLCFREIGQRMPHQAVYRAALKLDASCHCVLRYVDKTYNYRVGVVKTLAYGHYMALNKYWFALDSYGRAIINNKNSSLYYDSSESAIEAANHHARHILGVRGGTIFHTRFDHLTLYGGTDYREWIVSLPDYQRIFFGAHYFDHNVLANIRTTARTDHVGHKLLFIEEVQSDWHQAGARHDYDISAWGRIANAPFKKEWVSLTIKLMLIRASQNGFDGIAWPKGEIQETRYSKALQAIKRHYDADIPKSLNKLGKPFQCQVENTWIETRDPWLNLVKTQDKWRVTDGQGKFQTRAKYKNRQDAMAVLTRHCRTIDLQVPVFLINDTLRRQIASEGLPMFGETFV
jgi:hypothetical protein